MALRQKNGKRLALLMTVIVLVLNTPIILMVINSLQPTEAIIERASLLPSTITFGNYVRVLAETPFLTWSAPIEWSSLNVSAWSASGLLGRCSWVLVDGIPERCAV
ncbi:MAG: hypothetical protein GY835_24485 [bacterium]|nr:hypothetical protein [bacterium]